MCQTCGGKYKAYIPRLKDFRSVCSSCDKIYWNENNSKLFIL